MNDKPAWQSKTLWFNVVVLIATFVVDPSANLETMGIPSAWVVRLVAIGNGVLRIASIGAVVFRARP